jgi:high-affinity Fe2+/Pb2+ permease
MTQFLLFVVAILLILIFWELSKIHARLKKALRAGKESAKRHDDTSNIKVA